MLRRRQLFLSGLLPDGGGGALPPPPFETERLTYWWNPLYHTSEYVEGEDVPVWTDSSGNGFDATQDILARQGDWQPDAFGVGLPGVGMRGDRIGGDDGTGDFYNIDMNMVNHWGVNEVDSPWSLFFLLKTTANATQQLLYCIRDLTNPAQYTLYLQFNASGEIQSFYGGATTGCGNQTLNPINDGNAHLIEFRYIKTIGGVEVFVDGNKAPFALIFPNHTEATQLTEGFAYFATRTAGTQDKSFAGTWGGIVYYSGAFVDGNNVAPALAGRADVYQWYNDAYGLGITPDAPSE